MPRPPSPESAYTSGFYDRQRDASLEAASKILPVVFEVVRPRSVVDVGCGIGTWLVVAGQLGAERRVGIEGNWIQGNELLDPTIELVHQDLERPTTFEEAFDLAVSAEVAEHLSPERAESFIAELCGYSPHVLFSAAIPGQGGVNHLNERWQSYWARLFEARGYRPLDLVRPLMWNEPSIPIHYRQNLLLYVDADRYEATVERAGERLASRPWSLDLVHPTLHMNNWKYLAYMGGDPPLTEAVRIALKIPRLALRAVRRRLGR